MKGLEVLEAIPEVTAGNQRRTSLCRQDAAGRRRCHSGRGSGSPGTERGLKLGTGSHQGQMLIRGIRLQLK